MFQLLLRLVPARLAIDLDSEERMLLGEEAAHVDGLLVSLTLVRLNPGIQIDYSVGARGLELLTEPVVERIIQI